MRGAQTLQVSKLIDARMSCGADASMITVEHGGRRFAYGDLHVMANHIAGMLIGAGVLPGALVGLCLDRSAERIAALLAVWKLGGVVLALDPGWPHRRLREMAASAGAVLVLTDMPRDLGEGLPQLIVNADFAQETAADGQQAGWHHLGPQPRDGAYVICTSGSTGTPKAVEIGHDNLDNLVRWHIGQFHLTSRDRVSHIAGLGFDAAFWDVVPALCAGATLVLPNDTARSSPAALQAWLLHERITCAFVPTTLAERLFGLHWPASASLRVLLTGGEALDQRPPATLPFAVYNNYGPSECTVVATSGLVSPHDQGVPNIGRPIAGTRVYLLDPSGELVADGEAGEIVIGGAGVGQGYRHAPELTRLSFPADRFGPDPDARLYRTGDLGRWLTDGSLAFCGRVDEQEQIRGMRVEPAEVAHALSQHNDVEWCTVIGHGPARDRSLRAYLLLRPDATVDAESLRGFLQAVLPDPMIPGEFLVIDSVPLTGSGKLDIEGLAVAGCARPLPRAGFRAPVTQLETRLASIIGGLLGGIAVGLDDNFFFLGGHSLLGTQAVVRIRDTFGVQLALRDIFTSPTVAQLADIVTRALMARLAAMTEEEAELQAANGC